MIVRFNMGPSDEISPLSLRGGPNHADRFEEVRQELDINPI